MFATKSTPYNQDLALMKHLGLPEWEAPHQTEILVGKVIPYPNEEAPGEETAISVYVACYPSQFFRFVVVRKSEDLDCPRMEEIEIRTGSGTLSDYWPMAMAVADGRLVVGQAKKLTH